MTASLFLDNLFAWSGQVALLVAVGALAAMTLGHPRARLIFWQGVLAIALAQSFGSAVWFAFVVGLLNAVLWTLFWPLALPFKVLTLGLGGLLLNGLVFSLAGRISRGVQVSGCITGALASIGVTILNGVLMRILLGHY